MVKKFLLLGGVLCGLFPFLKGGIALGEVHISVSAAFICAVILLAAAGVIHSVGSKAK